MFNTASMCDPMATMGAHGPGGGVEAPIVGWMERAKRTDELVSFVGRMIEGGGRGCIWVYKDAVYFEDPQRDYAVKIEARDNIYVSVRLEIIDAISVDFEHTERLMLALSAESNGKNAIEIVVPVVLVLDVLKEELQSTSRTQKERKKRLDSEIGRPYLDPYTPQKHDTISGRPWKDPFEGGYTLDYDAWEGYNDL
jgi:hypothetical protein